MQELSPEYLAEIARQMSAISAFLGGFAAAFLGTLLTQSTPRRVVSWAVASAAVASVGFIITVIAMTKLVVVLHPQAPANVSKSGVLGARATGLLCFMLGIYALMASIGLSGWLRSRRMGIITSVLAGAGALLITLTLAEL
ncbi:hypothetical protein F0P96_14170 [Hymenobacter busanensis]|uniref:Uncharacterized protein n=1 Tax=Hymenobacter busanensis TaxID=2607656 RepID=A0A7L5A3P5_9BACT|nr:hypothetical protein [Hymenobacter busanensis]KAA9331388.1 hypothetical protein F0P96_14170 [Hymenobacter busanensis]QHJ08540.1 hypothetical protein GUY19_15095 [Hymenobacter busanensis]